MFCPKCGAEISENDVFCKACGYSLKGNSPANNVSPKSRLVAAVLAWYFGVLGIHRFYVGRVISGIFMILTLGGLGIWALIDAIVILCGEFKDSDGLKIRTWVD